EAGRIIERGTHDSLYAAGGRYYELYTKQHGLESNLFLAPGEGVLEPAEAPVGEPEQPAGAGANPDLSDAIRLIRGRDA
ncbi:MAG TPA: hypothetical protein VEF54_03390, partial [archaeon]|nr:hypothetical protein [archaeon]